MLQAGEGAQHTARANDAGGAQQLGLHFIAAGLQLLGQLFQTQQLGSALHRALGGQLCSLGGFGRVELGDLGSTLCGLAGLFGLGTDGGQRFTQGALFRCGFAGLGGTDVAFYGVGLRTYEAFLEDTPVDLAALYAAHPGKVYSMSLLNPAPEADLARPFDGAALCERFSHVLAYHGFDPVTVGFYGFLFLETDAEGTGADERDWLLRSDLMEFVGGAL